MCMMLSYSLMTIIDDLSTFSIILAKLIYTLIVVSHSSITSHETDSYQFKMTTKP